MNAILQKIRIPESASTSVALKWWAKVYTRSPFCIYYFGPFDQFEEAQDSQFGYIDDLEHEGAKVVFTRFLQLSPKILIVEYEHFGWARWLHEMMQDSLSLKVTWPKGGEADWEHPTLEKTY